MTRCRDLLCLDEEEDGGLGWSGGLGSGSRELVLDLGGVRQAERVDGGAIGDCTMKAELYN